MSTINLTAGESKLLTAVIMEMNSIPEVDFDVVAQKVGIKYGKNARQSFKKVWDKLKAGNGGGNGAANGDDTDDANGDLEVESPKKPVSKKAAAPKKASATKKGVAKTTGPKKASEGGPKAKAAPRKTKKQKEEEAVAVAAAAEAADQEDNEDEDMEEENEDGKSLNPTTPINQVANSQRVEPVVEAVALAAPVESVQPAEVVRGDGNLEADGDLEVVNLPIPMNDEYEAYIREMSLEAWLAWKAESEYTFNIIDIV